jgi:hypothetical protein
MIYYELTKEARRAILREPPSGSVWANNPLSTAGHRTLGLGADIALNLRLNLFDRLFRMLIRHGPLTVVECRGPDLHLWPALGLVHSGTAADGREAPLFRLLVAGRSRRGVRRGTSRAHGPPWCRPWRRAIQLISVGLPSWRDADVSLWSLQEIVRMNVVA